MLTRGAKVVGGHDGCNGWGPSEQPALIIMDAQECPPDAHREAYWALARGHGATYLLGKTRLTARHGKHVGVFVKA